MPSLHAPTFHLPAGRSAPPKLPEKVVKTDDQDIIVPKPAPAAPAAATKVIESHPAPAAPPAPILPDDVPAQVRPEDFLPYFQYPGAGPRGRAETPPAPPLPRSTATYTQSQ